MKQSESSIINRNNFIGSRIFSQQGILVTATIAIFIIFSVTTKGFLTLTSFYTLLRSMSIVTVLAAGVTFVITLGEIDLSIESLPGLTAAVFCVLLESKQSILVSMLAAFLTAMVFGVVNGIILVKTSLPSIVITLATNMIALGLMYIVTEQRAVVISQKIFVNIFAGNIFGFPVIVFWMAVMVALGYIILQRSKFGRNIEFVGDNRDAAKFSGLKISSITVISFLLTAGYSFIAGMMGAAQASNATPGMLREYSMTAIAATVIGGTVMSGGKGNMAGTILGAFFLSTIKNGFLILGIDAWVLYLINGAVILGTLAWRFMSEKSVEA